MKDHVLLCLYLPDTPTTVPGRSFICTCRIFDGRLAVVCSFFVYLPHNSQLPSLDIAAGTNYPDTEGSIHDMANTERGYSENGRNEERSIQIQSTQK